MRKLVLLFVIALLMVPFFVIAQGDPHENACYEGGSMWRDNGDGCPTEWHWTVGWYLAQWENNGGWSNPDNFFPEWGDPQNVLPPREVEEVEPESVIGCQWATDASWNNFYVKFGASYALSAPHPVYQDATCTTLADPATIPALVNADLVYAPWQTTDADARCQAAFGNLFSAQGLSEGDVYACTAV